MPAAHDARSEGASAGLLRFQQLRQDLRGRNLDRRVGADRFEEVALVRRVFQVQARDPLSERRRDLFRVAAGELALRLVARPALGRFEGGNDIRQRRIQERRRLHEGRRGRADPPDPAVRLVARRIAILVVLVADDRVVPVDDVDRAVGADLHVHRAEVPVAGVDERFFPLQGRPRTVGRDGEPLDAIRLVVADREMSPVLRRQVTTVEVRDAGVSAGRSDRAEAAPVSRRDLAERKMGYAARAVDAVDLAPFTERDAPGIPRAHEVVEKRVHLQQARTQPEEPGLVQVGGPPRGFDARFDAVALPHVQLAAGAPGEGTDRLVAIARSESAEQNAPGVGSSIAIRVLQKQQLAMVPDVDAAVAQFHCRRNAQALREDGRTLRDAVAVGILQHDDPVVRDIPREDVRIRRRDGHVRAAGRVPANRNRVGEAVRLRRKEIDLHAVRHGERSELRFDVRVRMAEQLFRLGASMPRVRTAVGHGPDALFRLLDQADELPPLLAEGEVAVARLGEAPRRVVAEEQLPVGGTPVVEPQAVLLGDCRMKRGQLVPGRNVEAELLRDRLGDVP